MAIAIDATAGGATANSFVTLVEAQAYVDGRLNVAAWTALVGTPDSLNRALVSATQELSYLSWQSRRSTSTQALAWPRWFVQNPDSPVGFLYDSTIVPDRVKNATCELALQFILAGTTDIAAQDPNLGVIRKNIAGAVDTQYQPYQKPKGLSRFPSVMRFIRPLLAGAANSTPILRG